MRTLRSSRLLGLAVVLALSACATAPGVTPSVTPTTASPTAVRTDASVKTDSGKLLLRVRHIPSSNGNELAKIATGSTILVDCKVKGSKVSGNQGSTDVWDHLSYQGVSGYVSAAYVVGGADASIPDCPYTAKIADAPLPLPATPGADAAATVVAVATSQLGAAEHAVNCNPYFTKRCEDWSTHFVTWVWAKSGIKIADMTQSSEVYAWGKKNGKAHDGLDGIAPGDIVLTGTGPSNAKTSTRADIVVAVQPNKLRVIGGNIDDRVSERDLPLSGLYGWVSAH